MYTANSPLQFSRDRHKFLNEKSDISMSRLKYLQIIGGFLTLIIIGRLIQLQLFEYTFYNNLAYGQYNNLSKIPAERGKIYLQNHQTNELIPIATNRTMDMIYADPKEIKDKLTVAEKLAPILEMKPKEIYEKINIKFKNYVRLVLEPTPEIILAVKNLNHPGVYLKTGLDYKLEEYQYEEDEVKATLINSISTEEKDRLRQQIIEVAADPTKIEELVPLCKKLAGILPGYSEKELENVLRKREVRYVPLKKRLTLEQSDNVKKLNIYGVVLWPENWRFYPEKSLMAHLLGFVDKQGTGQYGLEGQYDTILRGKDGERRIDLDIKGNPIAVGEDQIISPVVNGDSFVLTIDRSIQKFAEAGLEQTVKRHQADSGNLVVMNPSTGEIIALANYPSFDPNEFFKAFEKNPETEEYKNEIGPKVFYNSAVADAYEFGSTFKIITVAIGLDSGEMSEKDTVCDNSGEVKIDDFVIRNSDLKAHGCITLAGVLEKSSNLGALRIGLKVGAGVFRKYISDFGFGEYTDIGFNDENNGYLGPLKEWGKVKTANASFGQGITGTPLQLARAASAIANQGKLMQPILIKEIQKDGETESMNPHEVRRVISAQTAAKVTQMMISAVDNGYGKRAKINGYSVAGKTGTAQVAVRGGYSTDKYIASFIGFAPASNPKFVMLIKINHPRTTKWGEEVAAPLFKDVGEYILKYYEVPKDR